MSESLDLELPSWVFKKRDIAYGPWFNTVKLAVSTDGLIFEKTHRVLVDRGDVSNLCLGSEGRIIVAYQYFSFLQEKNFDKIAVSISSDDGETWVGPIMIRVNGLEKSGYKRPMDPALVLLSDGRLRLYATCGRKDDESTYGTVSAVSSNGINFEIEDGYRFVIPGSLVLDPAILKIRDEWHYYSPFKTQVHAVSLDGLNFKRVEDLSLPKNTFMLGSAVAISGGYRFYMTKMIREERKVMVTSAFSKDGYNWTMDSGVRIDDGADPGIVRLKSGNYLMSYHTKRKP